MLYSETEEIPFDKGDCFMSFKRKETEIVVVDDYGKRIASWISAESYRQCQAGDKVYEKNFHVNHLPKTENDEVILTVRIIRNGHPQDIMYATLATQPETNDSISNLETDWQNIIQKT